jgi:hypothetical protein
VYSRAVKDLYRRCAFASQIESNSTSEILRSARLSSPKSAEYGCAQDDIRQVAFLPERRLRGPD